MVVILTTKTINQGLVYGAFWVVVYEVGYCVDNMVRGGGWLEGFFVGCWNDQRSRGGGLLYNGCKVLWLVAGIAGFGLLDGCLEDCG